MRLLRSLTFSCAALALASCGGKRLPAIDVYTLNSVPEEAGTRFTMITTEADMVSSANVTVDSSGMRAASVNYFDVSPDGRTIAFLSQKNEKQNIFLKSTQGGMASTQRTFRDVVWDPAFSSDGSRISFADTRNGRINVFEIGALQGAAVRQVTNFEQVSHQPSYSPAGSRLAFVQEEGQVVSSTSQRGVMGPSYMINRPYVWEVDLDKNSFTQITEGATPTFSPDGKRLAVTRNSKDHGNTEIWVIDMATGTETVIATSKEMGYIQPTWSPDGKRMVFAGSTGADRSRPRNWDIFVVNVDGTALTQLTFHPGHDLTPRFSPDGNAVYFMSQRGNARRLWNIWRMEFRV